LNKQTISTLGLFLLLSGVGHTTAQTLTRAPDLQLKDIKGGQFKLSDYKGKVVLLNFWATWCAPCRKEIPDLVKKQRQYWKLGLRVVGVTEPPWKTSEVRHSVKQLKVNYPIALGTSQTKSLFDESDVLPTTIVIDRDGNIRAVIKGVMYEDEFEEKIKALLVGQNN
jgi:peroxiredoxin